MERTEIILSTQTINIADKATLDNVNNKIDTVDTVADNIYSKVDTEVADIKAKTDTIGATGDTGGTSTGGTVMAKLNKLITDVSSAVSNTVTNNTASKTGVLSAKLAYVISLLENTTYGLNAIKTATSSSSGSSSSTIKSI